MQSSVSAMQSECGVVKFAHAGPGDYFVYYLPHVQTGGGAGVVFTWFNCTDPTHGRKCVLDRTVDSSQAQLPAADACASVDTSAAAVAVSYENRPNSYGEHDHTPTGEPFHGFTIMVRCDIAAKLGTPAGLIFAWLVCSIPGSLCYSCHVAMQLQLCALGTRCTPVRARNRT
eukprot:COSAG02_NODE_1500_length_12266_cov_513.415468_6_plen_172_part_00